MSSVEANPEIEADEFSDQSAYESASGKSSETTSIASSIFDYKYENGRRYHRFRDGAYVLPNDETEQDRLDIIHHMYNIMLDGQLTLAPIGMHPQRILDVGTGTGIWAIDAADMYPSAEVIGTDLSPIQPSWVPPNCKFEIDDCESEWTFARNSFDLIHSRNLSNSIKDWPAYCKKIFRHAKPGGYLEFVETEMHVHSDDNTYPKDSPLREYLKAYHIAMNTMGIPNPCADLKRYVQDAGFVDVKEVKYKLPWGPWAKDKRLKEMGKFCLLNVETEAFEAYGMAGMVRYGGKTAEQAKKLCDGARATVNNRNIHVYNYQWVIIGRKPED